jgi:hypothetical protein
VSRSNVMASSAGAANERVVVGAVGVLGQLLNQSVAPRLSGVQSISYAALPQPLCITCNRPQASASRSGRRSGCTDLPTANPAQHAPDARIVRRAQRSPDPGHSTTSRSGERYPGGVLAPRVSVGMQQETIPAGGRQALFCNLRLINNFRYPFRQGRQPAGGPAPGRHPA